MRVLGNLHLAHLAHSLPLRVLRRFFKQCTRMVIRRVEFAKRPCCDIYKGMPSGHASGAFSGRGMCITAMGGSQPFPLGF